MEKVLKTKKILVVGFNTIDIVLESDEKLTTVRKSMQSVYQNIVEDKRQIVLTH